MSASCGSLRAGSSQIEIYGDGSFNALLLYGSWAFTVPALALHGAEAESGPGIETFEVMALLAGLHEVITVDQTIRPIHVYSDSQVALAFWRYAAGRTLLPDRKGLNRVRHLFDLAVELIARRRVTFTLVKPRCGPHRDCHRRAAQKLRHAIATSATIATQLTLRTEVERQQCLLREQEALQAQLTAVEEELLLTNVRLRALERAQSAARHGG
jgi:ribonuclease HI